MARPNYAFAKRQRELAKKQKKEDKLKSKAQRKGDEGSGQADVQDNAPRAPAQALPGSPDAV